MKNVFFLLISYFIINSVGNSIFAQDSKPVEIAILGTLHFSQFQDASKTEQNFFSESRQLEFKEVVKKLSAFKADAVFVEREPDIQTHLDSLFQEVTNFQDLQNGVGELYQIGFRLAKANNLSTVYGVDHYESVSQDLFEEGFNLQIFKDSLQAFQKKGRGITMKFLNGENTIKEFLIELNKPENIQLSHRLFFNTPAYVRDGEFKNIENFSDVDKRFIGAEYIALFYERNLKIYSNILARQKEMDAKRIVLIIGQVHVGVLQNLLKNNPNYKVVSVIEYLNK